MSSEQNSDALVVSQEARVAAARAVASYLFQECQPDRGDVFSWVDDRLDPLADAAIAAARPIIEAQTLERAAGEAFKAHPYGVVETCRRIRSLKGGT